MSRKKISTTVYITTEQQEQLKRLHELTKVPVAVYIRDGIDMILAAHSAQLQETRSPEALPPKVLSPDPEIQARAPSLLSEERTPLDGPGVKSAKIGQVVKAHPVKAEERNTVSEDSNAQLIGQ